MSRAAFVEIEWREAYERGATQDEIAAEAGVGRTTVKRALDRLNVVRRTRAESNTKRTQFARRWTALYAEGVSMDEIAARYRVAASTVRRALIDGGAVIRGRRDHFERAQQRAVNA